MKGKMKQWEQHQVRPVPNAPVELDMSVKTNRNNKTKLWDKKMFHLFRKDVKLDVTVRNRNMVE